MKTFQLATQFSKGKERKTVNFLEIRRYTTTLGKRHSPDSGFIPVVNNLY
jgi:hypothetical protein